MGDGSGERMAETVDNMADNVFAFVYKNLYQVRLHENIQRVAA